MLVIGISMSRYDVKLTLIQVDKLTLCSILVLDY